jgi:hypothetical protein
MKILKVREEPLSIQDKNLLSNGTMITLSFEGKEPFRAIIEGGTIARVDSSTSNFFSAGIKLNEEIRFSSKNVLGIY